MSRCPDDGRPLSADAGGALVCAACGGAAIAEADFEAPVRAALSLETRETSGAFVRERRCPSCEAPMAPWRIGKMDAWVERCPVCELCWLDRQDRRTLEQLGRRRARAEAMQTLKPAERAELASDLAAATAAALPQSLSPAHALLAAMGLPVVTRKEGERTPYATWAIGLVLIAVFAVGLAFDDSAPLVVALAYRSDAPGLGSAITANFAHFGLLHLLGNLYFLLAFGDGVEQRLPSGVVAAAFVALGSAAIFLEGALAPGPELIAGASGGIAALMGACIVLQPKARVLTALRGHVFSMPLWLYGVFEVTFQLLMLGVGARGTAWIAHLSGMALGAGLGFATRRR